MRLTLKLILAGSIGLLSAAAIGQGTTSVVKLGAIEKSADDVATNWFPSVTALLEIGIQSRDVRVKIYRLVMENDTPELRNANAAALQQSLNRLDDLRRKYEPMISSPEERRLYEEYRTTWARYMATQDEVVAQVNAGNVAGARAKLLSPDMAKLNQDAVKALQKDSEYNTQGATAATVLTKDSAASAKFAALIGVFIAIATGLGALFFALFRVSRPIEAMTGAMDRLASGDVGVSIPGSGRRDEIGAMAG
ncbi:MCP four helix bundle domain-containing protein, partial [Methylobacterium sp.]